MTNLTVTLPAIAILCFTVPLIYLLIAHMWKECKMSNPNKNMRIGARKNK